MTQCGYLEVVAVLTDKTRDASLCWEQVLGAVGVEVWVESSTGDADLFIYLEDVHPGAKIVTYARSLVLLAFSTLPRVHLNEFTTPILCKQTVE